MGILDMFRQSASERAVIESEEKYQVCEYGGELWLTYSGCLVCPCSMLKDGVIESLRKMRELFVQRTQKV